MSYHIPTVLVVDDDAKVCSAVKRLLRSAGYQVFTFEDTREVFSRGRPSGPSCLILDVHLPEIDGLQFQESLRRMGIQIPTIFVTGFASIPMTVKAIKSGAADFLAKPFDGDRLLAAVDSAVRADERILSQRQASADLHKRHEDLTPREREVFAAVTSGLLNKQAAAEMGIAEKTIKVHRARVMEKMGAQTVADLVRMADILDIRWKTEDPTEVEEMPGTGFSQEQEQISLLAAWRAKGATAQLQN